MANRDIDELIERIMSDERMRKSSHFSDKVYEDEPILRTGRQMANYLPDMYSQMRSISRWQVGEDGKPGRWLTEAELFYRQAQLMADFEDDFPYHGAFKSYYPTYNAMSDQQLRGYFTWRAGVRRGHVRLVSESFAYVYLYELINGIGVSSPADGFVKIHDFCRAFEKFFPSLERNARVWLRDYAVYHGLAPECLANSKTMRFDAALAELKRTQDQISTALATAGSRQNITISLPPNEPLEEKLFCALDELSSYQVASKSKLAAANRAALRHVACGVFIRMLCYYAKQRKTGYVDTLFGEERTTAYTMFGSAVFFEEKRHEDCEYELDAGHVYRCRNGFWECTRSYGARERNDKLGLVMRATDAKLRQALGFEPTLPPTKMAKYLQKFIDEEIDAWLSWSATAEARRVDIDLSALAGIRSAAETTRESLLIDEEREQGSAATETVATETAATETAAPPEPLSVEPSPSVPSLLDGAQTAYLKALLAEDRPAANAAQAAAGMSEDMLVDAINEALFDEIGDTVIEYGAQGPAIIEDYAEDLRGIIDHG